MNGRLGKHSLQVHLDFDVLNPFFIGGCAKVIKAP